ncbi:cellulase family glycosylhydrolase [Micromonospora thermarum]|uniref:Endoglucanase n=1 Tax=Micromonospora thermarum TaxID=2720024 RepID=A0ABX0Z800_9ACTN|nr:cellulase family glycosylhydrolase [Micromonospora thermarum]NJP33598.1 cellulase family glycosylhydrolase [Micromonospora thermarum]
MPVSARMRAAVVAACAAVGLTAPAAAVAVAAPDTPAPVVAAAPTADWLHTDGNRIVDEAGNQVWLTGVNWFGFNASERVFHGLWSANIETITRQMAERGINIVRVPMSTQLLPEWKAGQTVVPNVNPELAGKNNLQVFDHWLQLCEKYGLKVMLDVHSAEADNSGHVYPVWWKGTITPELFYQGWEWVTDRYNANDTIVAMDIKNEPHGTPNQPPRAKWDSSTDQDNFKYACETAGRRILAINPNLLILCEGIEVYPRAGETWNSPNTDPDLSPNYHYNWWGGNLRGVAQHPVNLGAHQDQLVYSPHDYGPLVFEQPWFQKDFDKNSLITDVWRPVLWQHNGRFVSLDHQVRLGGAASTTGISLAERYAGGGSDTVAPTAPGQPTVSDLTATGATLTWTAATDNVGVTSYDVLRAVGSGPATVVATVSGTSYRPTNLAAETTYTVSVRARDAAGNVSAPSAGRTFTTPAGGGGGAGCTATWTVTNSWQGGFQGQVAVKNTGTGPTSTWRVTWTNPTGTAISALWNGRLTTSGGTNTVTNEPYNGTLAAGASTTFGFTGTGAGTTPSDLACTAS